MRALLTHTLARLTIRSGVGGGVVAQDYFQEHFGFKGGTAKKNAITSNAVSVLQAGAFFGALGSAPISARISRRYTLIIFSIIFSVGTALFSDSCSYASKGLSSTSKEV